MAKHEQEETEEKKVFSSLGWHNILVKDTAPLGQSFPEHIFTISTACQKCSTAGF